MCLLILWPNVNFSVCKPSLHFLSIVWYFSLLAVRPLCWSLYWPSACNLWNTSKLKWPHWCVCMFYPDLKHAVNSVFFTVAVLNVNTFVLLLVLWFSCWGLGFVLHVVPVFFCFHINPQSDTVVSTSKQERPGFESKMGLIWAGSLQVLWLAAYRW